MISVWHLLWIIPLASFLTVISLALVRAGDDEADDFGKANGPPPMDEDMNRHSGLLEDD